jgi:DNA-binding protein HU-beta
VGFHRNQKKENTMTTKSDFIAGIAVELNCTLAEASRSLNAVIAEFKKLFQAKGSVTFKDFASIGVKERSARTGRNPKTGEPLSIPTAYVPYLKASTALKAHIKAQPSKI